MSKICASSGIFAAIVGAGTGFGFRFGFGFVQTFLWWTTRHFATGVAAAEADTPHAAAVTSARTDSARRDETLMMTHFLACPRRVVARSTTSGTASQARFGAWGVLLDV
jgi:hypothetical protein